MIECRCHNPNCAKLLAKYDGFGKVEIKCYKCNTLNLFTQTGKDPLKDKRDLQS